MIYTCKKCPDGCESCTAATQCPSASYTWFSKSMLLVISLICAAVTLLVICYAYRY